MSFINMEDILPQKGYKCIDLATFNLLFKQYSKPLFYFACKFVDDEVAKDIVQDIFYKLWFDKSITINHSINGLLFTMARNKCLQHIEKQKVRDKYYKNAHNILKEEELDYFSETKSLVEQELENKLDEVLNQLPNRCQQIFVLSRFDNKKNKEIAEELKISLKAVEKQISKALKIIRVELKEYLPLFLLFYSDIFKNNFF